MKFIILLSLFIISSCALYKDYQEAEFNWLGSGKPRPSTSNPKMETKSEPPKDMVTEVTTFEAKTISRTNDATFMVVKNDQQKLIAFVELKSGQLSYREGHSVEIKLDGETLIHQVEPTNNESSNILRFAESEKLAGMLKNKKTFNVELSLDEVGLKIFEFDITGLQEFFTAI